MKKVQFVFEEVDVDRDGLIDYEHFVRSVAVKGGEDGRV